MKTVILILVSLFSTAAMAQSTPRQRCKNLIREVVADEAAKQGKPAPAYELSEPEPVTGEGCFGKVEHRTCKKYEIPDHFDYASSVFFVDDGYIPDSGFTLTVQMNKHSCVITDLQINFGR